MWRTGRPLLLSSSFVREHAKPVITRQPVRKRRMERGIRPRHRYSPLPFTPIKPFKRCVVRDRQGCVYYRNSRNAYLLKGLPPRRSFPGNANGSDSVRVSVFAVFRYYRTCCIYFPFYVEKEGTNLEGRVNIIRYSWGNWSERWCLFIKLFITIKVFPLLLISSLILLIN